MPPLTDRAYLTHAVGALQRLSRRSAAESAILLHVVAVPGLDFGSTDEHAVIAAAIVTMLRRPLTKAERRQAGEAFASLGVSEEMIETEAREARP